MSTRMILFHKIDGTMLLGDHISTISFLFSGLFRSLTLMGHSTAVRASLKLMSFASVKDSVGEITANVGHVEGVGQQRLI